MSGFVQGIQSGSSNFVKFIQDGLAELKRVKWPNRKELVSYTIVVSVTCVVMIAIIFLFDLAIGYVFNLIGISH